MSLSIDAHAAQQFANDFADTTSEKQHANTFITTFYNRLIGVVNQQAVEFEKPVIEPLTKHVKWIDAYYADPVTGLIVLWEHKSRGKDLEGAEQQARNYASWLPNLQRPSVIIVSDFARIRIIDVALNLSYEFALADIVANLNRIEAVFSQNSRDAVRTEEALNIKAVSLITDLHKVFSAAGYTGDDTSVLLIRLLFMLYGDKTRMWSKGQFARLIEDTPESGSGLGYLLDDLFHVMSLPIEERATTTNADLAEFPYLGGDLFTERSTTSFNFNADMRASLIEASNYDWSAISPAIFGSMLQTIKSKAERRELGEHYTSEANILKVISPLLLDAFTARLRDAWNDGAALQALLRGLGSKRFLDPAAGSGNFLVVTFLRLREIELKIVLRLGELGVQVDVDGVYVPRVNLEMFHAIEYEGWSSQVAQVALWFANHQSNGDIEALTGFVSERPLLKHSSEVLHGNALRTEWTDFCPIDDDTFIIGNPPFNGSRYLTTEQKTDVKEVAGTVKNAGSLDYVAMWFIKAARYMEGTKARCAFVSTNSIAQGVQPAILWAELARYGMTIDFAHRSFDWANEAGGNATVVVNITAFSAADAVDGLRTLWTYSDSKGEPTVVTAPNINAYLLPAADVLISARSTPLCDVPAVQYGNQPVDGGGFISNISAAEAENIRQTDPVAAKYLRRLARAEDLLYNRETYALWLVGASPDEILHSPVLKARVSAVAAARSTMTSGQAKQPPHLWGHRNQPVEDYYIIPKTTTLNRECLPIMKVSADCLATGSGFSLVGALWLFAFVQSRVFRVWAEAISGRFGPSLQISNTVVYNNFPFPELSEGEQETIGALGHGVLDVRDAYASSTIDALYNSISMPADLRKAHRKLDDAVLAKFGLNKDATDTDILTKLFARYAQLTA